ncbi:hypothetical protein N657DRAFT_389360 [Parathielavia appendiculata]|uniref:Uncharacterized protein n=1 Tax=Parathielavia appendiculata TaxID=2587402 RepID=A0AAN6Z3Y5_9PEZI|nr:hypothetical protein N657DRAFT_389360 [Parathielavia appendiculata]
MTDGLSQGAMRWTCVTRGRLRDQVDRSPTCILPSSYSSDQKSWPLPIQQAFVSFSQLHLYRSHDLKANATIARPQPRSKMGVVTAIAPRPPGPTGGTRRVGSTGPCRLKMLHLAAARSVRSSSRLRAIAKLYDVPQSTCWKTNSHDSTVLHGRQATTMGWVLQSTKK